MDKRNFLFCRASIGQPFHSYIIAGQMPNGNNMKIQQVIVHDKVNISVL